MAQKIVKSVFYVKLSVFIILIDIVFSLNAQENLLFDFEDTTLTGWVQYPDSAWISSDIDPIDGGYSLHHIFDHLEAGHDQIAYPLTNLRLSEDTTIWRFSLKHAYNPSSSNNWAFFLVSDQSANEMYPSGSVNGYAVGVDYSGSDDLVKLWRISSGSASEIVSSGLDWQNKIGTSQHAGIEVIRTPDGIWYLNFDTTGSFDHFFLLGAAADDNYLEASYFGVYYEYSATQDQKLWIDDISIEGAFIQDTLAPNIDTVWIEDENRLRLKFSEKLSDSCLIDTNFFVNEGIGHPDSVIIFSSSEALLYFSNAFKDESWHNLYAANMCDPYGNCADTIVVPFYYYSIKPNSVVINEIMADPEPVVGLPEFEYIELFNTCTHPVNLLGWSIIVGTRTLYFTERVLLPDSFLTICHKDAMTSFEPFGEVTGLLTSLSSLTNSGTTITLRNEKDEIINQVEYNKQWYNDPDKEEGGWALEKIDPDNNCSGSANWCASVHASGGTPGEINSVDRDNMDTIAPYLVSMELLDTNILQIMFNESVTEGSAKVISHYDLTNKGMADSVLYYGNSVHLYYSTGWVSETLYKINISDIMDLCGNTMIWDTAGFYYYLAKPDDIVINEIMADPEPLVGLPEYEYLELYNRCKYPVSLTGWRITVGTKSLSLPSQNLYPDSFLIICHPDAIDELSEYGVTAGILSSQSILTNSGQALLLQNHDGDTIDQLYYLPSWYQDNDKDEGGWSIERIDPDNNCGILSNWKASTDPSGGTPGTINSVYHPNIDKLPPNVTEVKVVSNSTIIISFSEIDEVEGLLNNYNYKGLYDLGYPDTVCIHQDGVLLEFPKRFQLSVNHTLIISGLIDICNNAMQVDTILFKYEMPEKYQILVSEIMADPDPQVGLPEVEYIEIYNNSTINTNLGDWKLKIGNSVIALPDYIFSAGSYLIICDKSDSALFSLYGQKMGIANFPALINTGQTIVLMNPMNQMVHAVSYTPDWYTTEYKSEGGWSLEMVDLNNPCGDSDNWKESADSRGGTPGKINSVAGLNPDLDFPVITNATLMGDTTLLVQFNESLDSISVYEPNSYSVNNTIGNPRKIIPVYPDFTEVLLWFDNSFTTNTLYTLTIEGKVCDCVGNTITEKQEIQFAIPDSAEPLDLIVNEILFDPKGDGVDFVEIYNNSDKILDISHMLIGRKRDSILDLAALSEKNRLIFPNEFLALTINPEKVLQDYYSSNPTGVLEVNDLPNFSNESDEVVLLARDLSVLDAFAYSADMHYPLLTNIEGVSLERISYERQTNEASNWHSAAETVGFATPAYENSQHLEDGEISDGFTIEPEVFSPDNDGFYDLVRIGYKLDEPGCKVTIRVFDGSGRRICIVADNELLGLEGYFIWDGTNDEGQKAKMGIYIVYIEMISLKGEVTKMKKPCIIGGKFN
ncbi:MAG: lamin tail domain-containing protein [Bacteroidales bacterium]|nr:lamin tail domain-containing protein [Bacteroidales bacterium]